MGRSDIQSVMLVSSTIKREALIDLGEESSVLNLEVLGVSYSTDLEAGCLFIFPSFRASSSRGEPDNQTVQFSIEATFALTYSVAEMAEATDIQFQAFGVSTGIYNCWPYWREFLQSISTRLGIPPVMLPPFRI